MRTSIYLLLMSTAAGMSLVRGFVVAGLLPAASFTTYAVVVAVGTFLSNLLSFGLIEGTVKQFPRIAVSGGAAELLSLSDGAIGRLAVRTLYWLPLFAIITYLADRAHPFAFVAVALIAYGVAVLGVLASVQRALLNVLNVALANGLRATLYLVLASLGVWVLGLFGAVAGEILAAALGALGSRGIFKRTLRSLSPTAGRIAVQDVASRIKAERGVTLFVAYSATAVPIYLDRPYVAAVFSRADSAAYAVMILFATGATVFVNIVGQKVGPELIQRERMGASLRALMAHALKWSVAVIGVWIAIIAAAGALFSSGAFAFVLAKYALTVPMFVAVGLLGCAQITSLFEFILIARDMERQMLVLSLVYLGTACSVALAVALSGASVIAFIELLALARAAYLVLIVIVLSGSGAHSRRTPLAAG